MCVAGSNFSLDKYTLLSEKGYLEATTLIFDYIVAFLFAVQNLPFIRNANSNV